MHNLRTINKNSLDSTRMYRLLPGRPSWVLASSPANFRIRNSGVVNAQRGHERHF